MHFELAYATLVGMEPGVGGDPLQDLRATIERTSVPSLGDSIAEARELLSLLDAKITAAEAEYSRRGQAEVDGFATMATFVRHRCRTTLVESRRLARRAARLATWPELGEAWRAGRLTGAQVDLACAVVPERHVERFAATIDDTIHALRPLTAHQTGIVLRRWVSQADDFAQREATEAGIEPTEAVPERELSASRTLDDELVVRGSFDPDAAATIEKALTAATRDDAPGERRTPKQRRADALLAVCEGYLAGLVNPDGNRRTERLTVTADIVALYRAWLKAVGVVTAGDLQRFLANRPGLGELDRGLFLEAFKGGGGVATTLDGNLVTDALVAAVASGGAMELLLTAGNRLLNLGRSSRTFSLAQRRAVLARDGGCRGCGADPSKCDIHHVVPWEEGGCTDIDNAVALCRRCHHMLHRHRWHDRIEPDGTYTLVLEDGTTRTTRPPGLDDQLPRLPVATTAEAARLPNEPPRGRRPGCDCPCSEHRSPAEEAEHQHHRRIVLERCRRELCPRL